MLKKSARMPVLFLGHGSPMNAIEDNEYRRSWQALGAQFGQQLPRPATDPVHFGALALTRLVAHGDGQAQDDP